MQAANPHRSAQSDRPVAAPSPWIVRHGQGLGDGCTVLDVACGGGRHVRYFLNRGCRVTGVDRDPGAAAVIGDGRFEFIVQDLEDGSPWPLAQRTFDAVIVTNYLHRPLLPRIVSAVAPGGRLLYETFAAGNERFGRPRNPRFLLRRCELLTAVAGSLHVQQYEDLETPRPARIQRLAATRDPASKARGPSP
ncbi:MAG: class I SAM-dependent methyltransferase [Alphaproteobacteria bacterium]|nr:class I SAM-dependent methyltransferase [Alphaproteobacteria bacterium]